MTCPRCGREVKETAKFCHICGTDLSVTPAPAPAANPDGTFISDMMDVVKKHAPNVNVSAPAGRTADNIGYLVLLALSNLFVSLSIFYKTFVGSVIGSRRHYSIFDMFDFVDYLDDWGFEINYYTSIKVVGVIAVGIGLLSIVFLIKFLLAAFSGKAKRNINDFKVSSFLALLGMVMQGISLKLFNKCDDVGIMEVDFFHFSVWAWLVIIVAAVNSFYLYRLIGESSSAPAHMAPNKTRTKKCMKCGTEFTLGEQCPNPGCSSTSYTFVD